MTGAASAEVTVGWAPAPGDEALINGVSARWFPHDRWLGVDHVEPCADRRWAWLSGRWVDDDSAGRVMVWVDRLLVRRTAGRCAEAGAAPPSSF